MKKLLFLFLVFSLPVLSQSKDPDSILKKVINKFKVVEDYVVDVEIKIDVEFLKVPKTNATIYFKQPDKIHIESESFAMLPKEGLDFSPVSLLKKDHTAFYEREDRINGSITSVIKVVPLGETDDIILSTLWVDQEKSIVRKIESTTKTNGTFTIELSYDEKETEYPLPSNMLFMFNVDKMNIPKSISGDISSTSESREKKSTNTVGKVSIDYSNYKVNTGLQDKLFEEKKK